jgi:hypothetical protein
MCQCMLPSMRSVDTHIRFRRAFEIEIYGAISDATSVTLHFMAHRVSRTTVDTVIWAHLGMHFDLPHTSLRKGKDIRRAGEAANHRPSIGDVRSGGSECRRLLVGRIGSLAIFRAPHGIVPRKLGDGRRVANFFIDNPHLWHTCGCGLKLEDIAVSCL